MNSAYRFHLPGVTGAGFDVKPPQAEPLMSMIENQGYCGYFRPDILLRKAISLERQLFLQPTEFTVDVNTDAIRKFAADLKVLSCLAIKANRLVTVSEKLS